MRDRAKPHTLWLFVCAGCNLLSCSKRADAMVCGHRCLMRARRSGALQTIRDTATRYNIDNPAMCLQAAAVGALAPELLGPLRAGDIDLAEAMAHPSVTAEWERLVAAARLERGRL